MTPTPLVARVRPVLATDPAAVSILRAYITDVASRWYGRPATDAEVDAAVQDHPSDGLVPPRGRFWVVEVDGRVVGCAGVEHVVGSGGPGATARVGEVERVYVHPRARGQGLGRALLDAVEQHAREQGLTCLRLDTRDDLVESHRLYERHGFARVPAFSGGPYAQRWYAKGLGGE